MRGLTGDDLIAHTANAGGVRHPLIDHLRSTAVLASSFADAWGAADLGRCAGLLHDVGKASPEFQSYLRLAEVGSPLARSVDHKRAGAILAASRRLEPLACLIQGHHGGLHDMEDTRVWLTEVKLETLASLEQLPASLQELLAGATAAVPKIPDPEDAELFIRFLFSALVDADFLDTEAHFNPEHAAARQRQMPSLDDLRRRLDAKYTELRARASASEVNTVRAEIADHCRRAASLDRGIFRLAAPTGGGKTLAAMSFALEHAVHHDLRRVIVAIPFTSITEQTAGVYRDLFGGQAVLEHHSNVERPWGKTPTELLATRLSAENWDAPVVVTTTVQLLESLFANSTSQCRKLHRIARSVIVIDEAQALPPHLIDPIVRMLQQLCTGYGCSVVLSTATQPTSENLRELSWLNDSRDLVPEPRRYFDRLRRVEWSVASEPWTETRFAEELDASPQVLAIFNTRRDAVRHVRACGPGVLHLSTLQCGRHRRRVLADVRQRLAAGSPCRLVSTQVVEAGVDVDFPRVLRALGPFDSMVQAAGRCNREGRWDRGEVVLFQPADSRMPRGSYLTGTQITQAMLQAGPVDFDDPASAARYFASFYPLVDRDAPGVRRARRRLEFANVAKLFEMIPGPDQAVVIPYDDDARRLLARLASSDARSTAGDLRRILRQLQPFTVGLRPGDLERAREQGWIQEERVTVWTGPYDPVIGVGAILG
jgi:CRISPR-associated endonuclease/helicase Cas3